MKKFACTPLFLVFLFVILLVLTPASVSAGEFVYEGPPSFTVTYPDSMTPHHENPANLPLRLGTAGTVPILEVNVQAIPEGKTLETIYQQIAANIKRNTGSDGDIRSSEMITLACGTPANATLSQFLFQGWMPLDIYTVSAFVDDKWVTAQVIQGADDGITEPARSLKFK